MSSQFACISQLQITKSILSYVNCKKKYPLSFKETYFKSYSEPKNGPKVMGNFYFTKKRAFFADIFYFIRETSCTHIHRNLFPPCQLLVHMCCIRNGTWMTEAQRVTYVSKAGILFSWAA